MRREFPELSNQKCVLDFNIVHMCMKNLRLDYHLQKILQFKKIYFSS